MTDCWFVTGTDTDVGKTLVSCGLLRAAAARHYRAAGYKPVASGSEMTPDGLRNADALALQLQSNINLNYQEVNPVTLREATAPNIASDLQGQLIELNELSQGLHSLKKRADWILVEGAGGWYTPLSMNHTFADWVRQEALPVILVVGIKLGCINHAMLTTQAILQQGLVLVGWIANTLSPDMNCYTEYVATLRSVLLPVPFLGVVPYLPSLKYHGDIEQYLNLRMLMKSAP